MNIKKCTNVSGRAILCKKAHCPLLLPVHFVYYCTSACKDMVLYISNKSNLGLSSAYKRICAALPLKISLANILPIPSPTNVTQNNSVHKMCLVIDVSCYISYCTVNSKMFDIFIQPMWNLCLFSISWVLLHLNLSRLDILLLCAVPKG